MNSAAGNFGLSFGLAVAGGVMLASMSLLFTSLTNDSSVIPPAQKTAISTAMEDDAQIVSDTQLQTLVADEPEEVRADVLAINDDARARSLQIAMLIPVLACLGGLVNARGAWCGCRTSRRTRTKAWTSADRRGCQWLAALAELRGLRRIRGLHEMKKDPRFAMGESEAFFVCGAEGIRTPDPLHAMQVRYQLRHSPGALAGPRSIPTGLRRAPPPCPRDAEARGAVRAGCAAPRDFSPAGQVRRVRARGRTDLHRDVRGHRVRRAADGDLQRRSGRAG